MTSLLERLLGFDGLVVALGVVGHDRRPVHRRELLDHVEFDLAVVASLLGLPNDHPRNVGRVVRHALREVTDVGDSEVAGDDSIG